MIIVALIAVTIAVLPAVLFLSRHHEEDERQRAAMQRWATQRTPRA
jgi:hypothetical protein